MKKWIKEEDVMENILWLPPELWADHIADLDGVWMEDEDVEDVVLEQLEAAAAALGYELVKKKKNGVSPCPQCGCDSPILLSNSMVGEMRDEFYYYQCPVCHLSNRRVGSTAERALMYWNSMVGEMRCK